MLDWVVDFTTGTVGLARAVLLAAFTVLLTATVARQWQQRNWLVQQRISDQEKLSAETKKLFDDFVALSSKRRFRSQRLFWALKAKDPIRIADARKAYDEVLYEWNDADLSWRVRFVKNLDSGTYILADVDDRIQIPFIATGNLLERGIKRSKTDPVGIELLTKQECSQIEHNLNVVSRAIFEIGRNIYGRLDYLSAERLDGDSIVSRMLAKGQFVELTISQLFKAVLTSSNGRQL
ncbi:MAG: hypothetical protein WCE69_03815 [Aestuariivirga sp.]